MFDSATPWTVAHQAPLSMEFSRQEYWSGLPCPHPGDLPHPGIEPGSPCVAGRFLPSEPSGKPTGVKSPRRPSHAVGVDWCAMLAFERAHLSERSRDGVSYRSQRFGQRCVVTQASHSSKTREIINLKPWFLSTAVLALLVNMRISGKRENNNS